MLRKPLLLVALCLVILGSASSAFADGFNPRTQSHYGACSRETTSVKLAVHDYAANGVLSDFAHLVGFHGSDGALTAKMRRYLVVAPVLSRVVTANHGCDDEGQWFPVGPRTLGKGELVGVKVPSKLRAHLCGRLHHSGCKRVILSAKLVFPITCWNPNMGNVKVVLYVHHKKKRKPKHHVKPKREEAAPPPEEKPAPPAEKPVVTTPAPAAVATQRSCSEGDGVVVTLSNASTATADASFVVNGTSYGPIAPGASQAVPIALKPGESTTITVTSGSSTLINGESFSNACKAEPSAALRELRYCQPPEYLSEAEVELSNAASATWPATFVVEWTGLEEKLETKTYEVQPGKNEIVTLVVGAAPGSESYFGEFTVSSEGKPILEEHEIGIGC